MEGIDWRCWVSTQSARRRDDERARELKESDGENREVVWNTGFGSGKQDTNIKYRLKFLFMGPDRILSFLSLGSSWLICPLALIWFHPVHSLFLFSHSTFSYILLPRYHRGLCTIEKQTAEIFRAAFVCTGWLDINRVGWGSLLADGPIQTIWLCLVRYIATTQQTIYSQHLSGIHLFHGLAVLAGFIHLFILDLSAQVLDFALGSKCISIPPESRVNPVHGMRINRLSHHRHRPPSSQRPFHTGLNIYLFFFFSLNIPETQRCASEPCIGHKFTP